MDTRNFILPAIITFWLLIVHANLFSQESDLLDRKVSLDVVNKSVVDILTAIEKQADVNISYESHLLISLKNKSINLADIRVGDVLEIIFYNTGLNFSILNDQIVIYASEEYQVPTPINIPHEDNSSVEPQKPRIDTVYKFRTDTLILVRLDTIHEYHIDTVLQPVHDTVIEFLHIKTSVFDKYNSRWSVRILYQTHGFSFITDRLHPGNKWLYDEIKKSESSMISMATILSAVYTFGNNSLSAGLGYYQLQEGIHFDYILIANIDSTYSPADSSWLVNYDTNSVFYSGNNKYQYITLPLSWGVKFCVSPRFYTGLDLFLYVNYLVKVRGRTISMNGELTDLDIADFRRFTASIFINPNIEYEFLNGISIYFSPNIGWQLSSDFVKTYFWEKKRFFYGATLGLQYNF